MGRGQAGDGQQEEDEIEEEWEWRSWRMADHMGHGPIWAQGLLGPPWARGSISSATLPNEGCPCGLSIPPHALCVSSGCSGTRCPRKSLVSSRMSCPINSACMEEALWRYGYYGGLWVYESTRYNEMR